MGVSFNEMLDTPYHVIVEDLQMLQLEEQHQPELNENPNQGTLNG